MKAIMISIRPQWVAKILNGEKTIEIRKTIPKDFGKYFWNDSDSGIEVYIYCTKGRLNLIYDQDYDDETHAWGKGKYILVDYGDTYSLNGKVVARFWCDKVDNYVNGSKLAFENGTYIFGTNADFETILKPSCLTEDELYDYCEDLSFKAIHITKLEIFDKPKELSEFKQEYNYFAKNKTCSSCPRLNCNSSSCLVTKPLTRAPQSWCYIEV